MQFEQSGILDIEVRSSQLPGSQAMIVRGVAATFNQPTVLYEIDGIQYKEQIAPGAFDTADMSNVIFNYDHSGPVMARTRNSTLRVWVESDGLHIRARLDGTAEGRSLHEAIKGGYIDRMSYAYSVQEESYDAKARTRTILKIKKVYDVSAVGMPAYESTSIGAYDETQERARLLSQINGDDQRKRLALLTKL